MISTHMVTPKRDWAVHFQAVSLPYNVEFGARRGRNRHRVPNAGVSYTADDPSTGDTNYSPDGTNTTVSSGGSSASDSASTTPADGTSTNASVQSSTVNQNPTVVDNTPTVVNVQTNPALPPVPVIVPPNNQNQNLQNVKPPVPVAAPSFFSKLTASFKAHPYLWLTAVIGGALGITLLASPHKIAGHLAAVGI